jgi:signal transduction histidine kinase
MHNALSFGVANEEVRLTNEPQEIDGAVKRCEFTTGAIHGDCLPVGPLVEDVIAIVESLSAASRVEVFVHSNLGTLTGDSEAISGALHQLIVDAILATPPGAAVFVATYQCEDGSQHWTVRDMGAGLTAENRHGIRLARDVVERHGGDTSVETEPGRGTLVSLWWPRREHRQPPTDLAVENRGMAALRTG